MTRKNDLYIISVMIGQAGHNEHQGNLSSAFTRWNWALSKIKEHTDKYGGEQDIVFSGLRYLCLENMTRINRLRFIEKAEKLLEKLLT